MSSDGKASVGNTGDPASIPGLGRSPGGNGNPLQYPCLENPRGQKSLLGYSPWGRKESDTTERPTLHGSAGGESACNLEDLGSISGLGRFPGEGKGYPLQYSGLENSMDCIVHGVAKSRTLLSNFHTIYIYIHTFFFRYILCYLYFLLLDYMFFYIYENIYIFFFRSFSIICIFKDFFEMDHF